MKRHGKCGIARDRTKTPQFNAAQARADKFLFDVLAPVFQAPLGIPGVNQRGPGEATRRAAN